MQHLAKCDIIFPMFIKEAVHKFVLNHKRLQIAKAILKSENNAVGSTKLQIMQ